MASNSFGTIFRITTWGESHGQAIGVVIDGCPSGVDISSEEVNYALHERSPGTTPFVSKRKEKDEVEILSGIYLGKTTGAPISMVIRNTDCKSEHYDPIQHLLRPGHAGFSYLKKYGIYDHRGGGRASARETACRVAASVIAKKILEKFGVRVCAYLSTVGSSTYSFSGSLDDLIILRKSSSIFCPDRQTEMEMVSILEECLTKGDSIGGQVSAIAEGIPAGLGDPIYDKLDARLAYAMMGLPASKAFEIGQGVYSASLHGSAHNDSFQVRDGSVKTSSNHSGGVLGGISTGDQLQICVTFKPTSSIRTEQKTVSMHGEESVLKLPEGSRHDPCVAIRAVPVVEAMLALVLVDALLLQNASKLQWSE